MVESATVTHNPVINVVINLRDVETGKPAAPTVTRWPSRTPVNPALGVAWTAPAANGLTITGYHVQSRKKAAEGEDPVDWPTNNTLLPATTTSILLANMEAGATYEARVRAVTSEEGPGDWSDTGEGTANNPPTATSALFATGSTTANGVKIWRESAMGAFFEDADGDTLTYSASSQHPALVRMSLSGEAGNAVLAANLLNPGASELYYKARDAYGGK